MKLKLRIWRTGTSDVVTIPRQLMAAEFKTGDYVLVNVEKDPFLQILTGNPEAVL